MPLNLRHIGAARPVDFAAESADAAFPILHDVDNAGVEGEHPYSQVLKHKHNGRDFLLRRYPQGDNWAYQYYNFREGVWEAARDHVTSRIIPADAQAAFTGSMLDGDVAAFQALQAASVTPPEPSIPDALVQKYLNVIYEAADRELDETERGQKQDERYNNLTDKEKMQFHAISDFLTDETLQLTTEARASREAFKQQVIEHISKDVLSGGTQVGEEQYFALAKTSYIDTLHQTHRTERLEFPVLETETDSIIQSWDGRYMTLIRRADSEARGSINYDIVQAQDTSAPNAIMETDKTLGITHLSYIDPNDPTLYRRHVDPDTGIWRYETLKPEVAASEWREIPATDVTARAAFANLTANQLWPDHKPSGKAYHQQKVFDVASNTFYRRRVEGDQWVYESNDSMGAGWTQLDAPVDTTVSEKFPADTFQPDATVFKTQDWETEKEEHEGIHDPQRRATTTFGADADAEDTTFKTELAAIFGYTLQDIKAKAESREAYLERLRELYEDRPVEGQDGSSAAARDLLAQYTPRNLANLSNSVSNMERSPGAGTANRQAYNQLTLGHTERYLKEKIRLEYNAHCPPGEELVGDVPLKTDNNWDVKFSDLAKWREAAKQLELLYTRTYPDAANLTGEEIQARIQGRGGDDAVKMTLCENALLYMQNAELVERRALEMLLNSQGEPGRAQQILEVTPQLLRRHNPRTGIQNRSASSTTDYIHQDRYAEPLKQWYKASQGEELKLGLFGREEVLSAPLKDSTAKMHIHANGAFSCSDYTELADVRAFAKLAAEGLIVQTFGYDADDGVPTATRDNPFSPPIYFEPYDTCTPEEREVIIEECLNKGLTLKAPRPEPGRRGSGDEDEPTPPLTNPPGGRVHGTQPGGGAR